MLLLDHHIKVNPSVFLFLCDCRAFRGSHMSDTVKGLSGHQCPRMCLNAAEHTVSSGQLGHLLVRIFLKQKSEGLFHQLIRVFNLYYIIELLISKWTNLESSDTEGMQGWKPWWVSGQMVLGDCSVKRRQCVCLTGCVFRRHRTEWRWSLHTAQLSIVVKCSSHS